ncbi:hypothetical protein BZA05DRAFT_123673 [Tricharina praecox]|uniref:uncharacterized protein n=1 Tax=Tricharina praecox TaxID=43433 RepID=UPI00221F9CA0|nr:uncharacterized protein BZA05DRAFT_123673 [Tricharina praecox]KAI5847462.1 hypothetical protein BZA05DRAFT_123673 [Tricharina praecox]
MYTCTTAYPMANSTLDSRVFLAAAAASIRCRCRCATRADCQTASILTTGNYRQTENSAAGSEDNPVWLGSSAHTHPAAYSRLVDSRLGTLLYSGIPESSQSCSQSQSQLRMLSGSREVGDSGIGNSRLRIPYGRSEVVMVVRVPLRRAIASLSSRVTSQDHGWRGRGRASHGRCWFSSSFPAPAPPAVDRTMTESLLLLSELPPSPWPTSRYYYTYPIGTTSPYPTNLSLPYPRASASAGGIPSEYIHT